jgi:ketosteroid isomerase-like protein
MSENVGTVAAIYEAFGRGDVPAILDRLCDDVQWEQGIRETAIPYYVPGIGKEHVVSFFQNLAATLDLSHFEPLAICDGGDIVTVPIRYAGRIIGGGEIPMDIECHVWRFAPDGKVAAFNHVLDLTNQERAFEQRTSGTLT